MHTAVNEIETHYRKLIRGMDNHKIDFWGINITDAPGCDLVYKVYQSQTASTNGSHPLVEYVRSRSMLRYYAEVADSKHPAVLRTDISLYQRSDSNMEGLFAYLCGYAPFFKNQVDAVKNVAQMKITDQPGYRYASVYHVGSIEESGTVRLLKFHFFTRWCVDPNRHTRQGYRDEVFLEDLRNTGIPHYDILAQKASSVLSHCGGHLWMAGMDIAPDGVKYKIYMKDICGAYRYLPTVIGTEGAAHLEGIGQWNELHPECRLAGAALALDTENTPSLNLYYHVD